MPDTWPILFGPKRVGFFKAAPENPNVMAMALVSFIMWLTPLKTYIFLGGWYLFCILSNSRLLRNKIFRRDWRSKAI